MKTEPVWLSGRFTDSGQVSLPPASLTLTQGIAAYETIRIVGGHAPWLERHVQRLRAACRTMHLEGADRNWAPVLEELSARSGHPHARARITIGDGFALATCGPLPQELESERTRGVTLTTHAVLWGAADIKSVSRWPLVRAERDAGGEVLLSNTRGGWLETSRANVFAWIGDELWTAPEPSVLPGIARAVVLELAPRLGLRVVLEAPPAELTPASTELFLTNALRGLRPVAQVDGVPLRVTERTRRLQHELDRHMGLSV